MWRLGLPVTICTVVGTGRIPEVIALGVYDSARPSNAQSAKESSHSFTEWHREPGTGLALWGLVEQGGPRPGPPPKGYQERQALYHYPHKPVYSFWKVEPKKEEIWGPSLGSGERKSLWGQSIKPVNEWRAGTVPPASLGACSPGQGHSTCRGHEVGRSLTFLRSFRLKHKWMNEETSFPVRPSQGPQALHDIGWETLLTLTRLGLRSRQVLLLFQPHWEPAMWEKRTI